MASASVLGVSTSTLGDEMTYGEPPTFGATYVVTASHAISFVTLGEANVIYGDYTPDPNPHILFRQDVGVLHVFSPGIIERLLLEAKTFDITHEIIAGDRSIVRYLERQSSSTFPANGQPLSAIQDIGAFELGDPPSGGTWDIVFTMQNGDLVTVTNQWTDAHADVQTNVDTVMAGEIVGYAAGDIVVTDPSLIDDPYRLSFTGNSVKFLHWENVSTVNNLTGTANDFGPVTVVQYGHPARYGWSVLLALGVINTLPTDQMGVVPSSFDVNPVGSRADFPPQWVVRALADEMAFVEDNIELKNQLFAELGIS